MGTLGRNGLKILWCKHRNILKYVWSFFNILHERVNAHTLSTVSFIKLKKFLRQNVDDNLRLPMHSRIAVGAQKL